MPARETERMMKLQDVILKAMAKKLTWVEAAEIAGMSVRNMQRKRQAYIDHDYNGLFDQRRGKRSVHRVPMATAERVLALYRDKYPDFNVRHFHEKLKETEGIALSYSWVKQALQGAGLVVRKKKRGPHRRRRPRRPFPGMLLHIDGSKHRWFNTEGFQDDRYYDLIVMLDDATSRIYYAQLVEEESTRTVMAALREVIEREGLFCALYSDRASHFFLTPKAGEPVDKSRLTQVGRALKELGIQMIPAYSPQARGRSERSFGTWQSRLPQELRLAAITTVENANRFLREHYIAEFNRKFAVKAPNGARLSGVVRVAIWIGCSRSKPSVWWKKTTPSQFAINGGNWTKLAGAILLLDKRLPSINTWTAKYPSATVLTSWAVEMTDPCKPWKTKSRFPAARTAPWKPPPALPTFPPPNKFSLSRLNSSRRGFPETKPDN